MKKIMSTSAKVPKGIPLNAPRSPARLKMLGDVSTKPKGITQTPKSVSKIANQMFRRGGRVR